MNAESRAQYGHRADEVHVKTHSNWTITQYDGTYTPTLQMMLGQTSEERLEAGLALLWAGETDVLIAKQIPLTEEAVQLLMRKAPQHLETILSRLWEFRGVNHRHGWPYDGESPVVALRQTGDTAHVAVEVLATWSGRHYIEYIEAVEALDGRTDRLETYLTLLTDWRQEAGTQKYGVPAAVSIRAAHTAAGVHP